MGDVEQYSVRGHRAGKADCMCVMCQGRVRGATEMSELPGGPRQMFGKRALNQDDIDRRNRRVKWGRRLAWLFTICAILCLIYVIYPK